MAENQSESKVKFTRIKGTNIAKISIQNPPMNQLSEEVLMLIASYVEQVRTNEKAEALIIEGKGLFSAGADVREIYAIAREGNIEKAKEVLDKVNAVVNAIENLGKPTVAVISGFCLGGGNELAMGCTFRLASDDAKFGQPEIKLGIMPGMGGTQRLPRLIDMPMALKLLLSGEMIPAQEALTCGLVDRVVPKSELDADAVECAGRLIGNLPRREYKVFPEKSFDEIIASDAFKEWTEKKSAEAVEAIVYVVRWGMRVPLDMALKLEQDLFSRIVLTDSAKAGLAKLAGAGKPSKGARFLLPAANLPDVFTVGDLNEEQILIRDSVRELIGNTIGTPEAGARIESKDLEYQRKLMREFADLGVLGIEVPDEYGGVNLGTIVSTLVAEEMAVQGSFATTIMAHSGIGTLPIRYFGTEEQKQKYLPKLVSGEWIACYCLTEGRAGSDAGAVKTTAVKSENGRFYTLNGEKIFVTNGGFADLFTIFAQLEGHGLTAFILEKNFTGLNIGKEEHKMGIQGSSTATVNLTDVVVPAENLLGEPGKGFKIALNILNLGRFKLGAACLGAGKLCLKESLSYAKDRKQFGRSISNFEVIRRKLAEMAVKNYEMEAIVYRTAGLLEEEIHNVDSGDSGAILKAIEEYAVECSIVKVFCSEALDFIVDENVQIHGGSGFCEELPPARHYRDSRINRIFEGTNEINRLVTTGMTLKKALMGSLPIIEAAKNVMNNLSTGDPVEVSELDSLSYHLNNAKKATLLSFGMVYEKFGVDLEKHQMVLMNLADCLIAVYVMESVLAALNKNRTDMNLLMVRLAFSDNLFKLEKSVRELAGMCLAGDELKKRSEIINRLMMITPENVKEVCNKIADNLLGT